MTRVVLLLVTLYPALEFFVWTPLVMKVYCPKADSDFPSPEQRLNLYNDAHTLLLVPDAEDPRGLPSIILALIDSVDEVVVPVSRIGPSQLREYLVQTGGHSKFVSFSVREETKEACTTESESFVRLLESLPAFEQKQAADLLKTARERGRCIGVSLSDVSRPDFLSLERDSTILTSAGQFRFRESIGVPLNSADGSLSRSQSGRLDPTLPVTWFVSRLLSNGYLSCPAR